MHALRDDCQQKIELDNFFCCVLTVEVIHTRLTDHPTDKRLIEIPFVHLVIMTNLIELMFLIRLIIWRCYELKQDSDLNGFFLFPLSLSFRNNCYVYPMDHHHHHSHSHIRCNCDSTTTYNEQTTTTTRQSTHSPCPLFNSSTVRSKKRQDKDKSFQYYLCSWKTTAIVFILTTLCFLTSTLYLSMMRYYNATFPEINQTHSKTRYDNLFYGSSHWPLIYQQKRISETWQTCHWISFLFILGKTTRFIRLGDKIKETVDAQSSTQLQFYVERTLTIQLNFTANRRANFGKSYVIRWSASIWTHLRISIFLSKRSSLQVEFAFSLE